MYTYTWWGMGQILTYIKDKLHLEPFGKLGCTHPVSGFRRTY